MRPGGWGIAAAGLALVVAGCVLVGGSDDIPTVRVTVRDLAYDQDVYRAPAGRIRFELRATGTSSMVIPDGDGGSALIASPAPPGRDSVVVSLPPGEYPLVANIPGHAAAGQEAVLIVTDDD